MARSPRISGAPLKQLAHLARTRLGGLAVQRVFRADLEIHRLFELPDTLRGDLPLDTRVHAGRPPREHASAELAWPEGASWAPSLLTLGRAYRERRVTPVEVTERVHAEAKRLAALEPTIGPLLELADDALGAARESARRIAEDRARSPLEGIPWAVKEQTAVAGLHRRAGTTFLSDRSERDAFAVARFRERGGVTVGTTPMTELGMTPNGANANRAMPRNPHDPRHFAGGSSTGSGVAVATGLVPIALGADGGGSIRIPSALNGVFGIKPTWGRVSRSGDFGGGTVSHLGPLATSTVDLAHALEALSGHDSGDPQTFAAPLEGRGGRSAFVPALSRGVRGLVVGVPESEWADASEPVARAGRAALAALEKAGATLVPVALELAKHALAVGVIIIACEARAGLLEQWRDRADEMTPDLQITFASLEGVSGLEYLETCRVRTGLRQEVARAFTHVDLIALPSVVAPAGRVSDTDMRTGFLDTKVIEGLCRFAFLGNLTGLPSLSAPVGCDSDGLPVGLQLVGDAWDEATVLAAAAHLERVGAAEVRRPRITARIL